MRESVGSTWTFGLVITFIFLFSSFLVLTINYTKAYKVKNETISIIENAGLMGLPIPGIITNAIETLKKKSEEPILKED